MSKPAKSNTAPKSPSVDRNVVKAALKALTLNVAGQELSAEPREFSTGSLGWFLSGKIPYTLPDGTTVKVQVGINAVICGSKPDGK
jgi:hypothetical protein